MPSGLSRLPSWLDYINLFKHLPAAGYADLQASVSGEAAVAKLELLAAAARAKVVAADPRQVRRGRPGRGLVQRAFDFAGLGGRRVGDVGDTLGAVLQLVG